jgi:F-type H+-transporting ATPase subunit b
MNQILNILGSLGFNWHVALANSFNFLIILYLLNKFFFRKIGATIDTRQNIIDRGLNQARDAERALASAEDKKSEIIKAARLERDIIVANGEALARDVASTIEREAQESITARIQKIDEREAGLIEAVDKAFREKAPSLIVKLYAKTLIKELTEEDNNKLISRMEA